MTDETFAPKRDVKCFFEALSFFFFFFFFSLQYQTFRQDLVDVSLQATLFVKSVK